MRCSCSLGHFNQVTDCFDHLIRYSWSKGSVISVRADSGWNVANNYLNAIFFKLHIVAKVDTPFLKIAQNCFSGYNGDDCC